MSKITARQARLKRKARIRRQIEGSPEKPRLSVYRGNRNIYCQIIDDLNGITLASASSRNPEISNKIKGFSVDTAKEVGSMLALNAKAKGIEEVVFDRSGYKYHGKIKALADAARAGGLKF